MKLRIYRVSGEAISTSSLTDAANSFSSSFVARDSETRMIPEQDTLAKCRENRLSLDLGTEASGRKTCHTEEESDRIKRHGA